MAPVKVIDALRGLGEDGLTELLRLRPDLLRPAPRDLAELSSRVSAFPSIGAAVEDLPALPLATLEGVVILGGTAHVEQVVRLFGPAPPTTEEVEEAAADLGRRLLLHRTDDGTLDALGPVRSALVSPANLGPSYEQVEALDYESLGRLAWLLGLPRERSRAAYRSTIAALLRRDPQIVERLPAEWVTRLRESDTSGPLLKMRGFDAYAGILPIDLVDRELLLHALVVPVGSSYAAVLREVALALRGDTVLTLPKRPAVPAGAPVDDGQLTAEAAPAAYGLLEVVRQLAEVVDGDGVSTLQSGGVGVRELRRLATLVAPGPSGAPSPGAVAFVLELLAAAKLVATTHERLVLASAYDAWAELEHPQRWARLVAAWPGLTTNPAPRARSPRKLEAVLGWNSAWAAARGTRERLQRVLLEAPGGVRLSPQDVVDAYAWRHPERRGGGYEDRKQLQYEDLVPDLLAELSVLGLVVGATPTEALRGLVRGDGMEAAGGQLFAAGVDRVRAQADGTLVAVGSPSLAMRTDLDLLADVESSGSAVVWRVSERSIGRAFDAGWDEDAVLAALQRWAGELPQPMAYLVGDSARRYGRLQLGPAGSWLRSEDPALLADVVATKKLRPLGLRLVAPTVLVSSKPMGATADALRAAGFTPVAEHSGAVLRRRRPPRVDLGQRPAPAASPRSDAGRVDPRAHAERLLDLR